MACPSNCASCCSSFNVHFDYYSLFSGDTYTLIKSGCVWIDNTSYANREVTLFCDSIDGWMITAYDSAVDCTEYYVTGDTTSQCPPTNPASYVSVSISGSGCYEGTMDPPGGIIDIFNCSIGSVSSGFGIGNSWLLMFD